MSAQRRRNGLKAKRKQQQQQKQRQRSQSTSDEGSSDDNSITRCICGEVHDVGLMVQCDKCEVWQHCECMGLAEVDIPEQYYCEVCKPENHVLLKTNNGRTRRTYDSSGKSSYSTLEKKTTKKRTTMNSQEASMSLEDILAARQALGFSTNNMNAFLSSKSTFNSSSTSNGENHDHSTITTTATTGKRKRDDRTNLNKNDDEDHHQNTDSPAQSTSTSDKDFNHHNNLKQSNTEPEGTESEDTNTEGRSNSTPNPTKVKRTGSGKSKVIVLDDNIDLNDGKTANTHKNSDKKGRHTNSNNSGKRNGNNGNGRKINHNPRSRTSTPQPNDNNSLQSNASLSTSSSSSITTTTTTTIATTTATATAITTAITTNNNNPSSPSTTATVSFESSLLERFSAESRATSPPAKVRYPNPRMSKTEMNRRAQQILDYISSIQVDMANKTNNNNFQNVTEYPGSTFIVHQEEYKPNAQPTSTPASSSSSPSSSVSASSSVLSSSLLENVQINEKTELDQDGNIISAGTEKKTRVKQRPSLLVIPEKRYDDGPSSSLSSASTIPLDNSNPGTPEMDLDEDNNNNNTNNKEKHEETSLEIMDRLTREIIKFQQKFCTFNNSHHRRTHSQS